jgi:hypothetical protein
MKVNDEFKFLKKSLKNEDDMLNMCATVLGCAMIQSQYIIDSANFIEVPSEVNYALALIIGNYMNIFNNSTIDFSKLDLSDIELPKRDKTIKILKHLIEIYKDDLK